MTQVKIGFLHPGAMGVSLAASAQNSGHTAVWASEGRSAATRERAETHALVDAGTLDALCELCDVIVSICPPHAAEDVAADVLARGFGGLYLDANAISPARTRRIADRMARVGVSFVDGGVIGGPAWKPDSTCLYLAGPRATEMTQYFNAGPLETSVLGEGAGDIGRAAALKMCFAAYTKGSTALLAAILAVAEVNDVRDALERQWSRRDSPFARQTQGRVRGVTAKAWRFEGEMHEIAATFEQAGLSPHFHQGAAEIYHRLAGFKESAETPPLDTVLDALLVGEALPRPELVSPSLPSPADDPYSAEVRATLQAFQEGYTRRDPERLDAFMDLFVADETVEIIGTGATTPGDGEWCLGRDAVRQLIESDWRYWGNLNLDIAGARIHVLGDVAWLAAAGTVTDHIERGPAYERYVDYARDVVEQEQPAEMKMLELIRTGTHALYELAQGEDFVWLLRFTAVLVRRLEGWRFHRMQFSFPTTRYPDVRQEAPF